MKMDKFNLQSIHYQEMIETNSYSLGIRQLPCELLWVPVLGKHVNKLLGFPFTRQRPLRFQRAPQERICPPVHSNIL